MPDSNLAIMSASTGKPQCQDRAADPVARPRRKTQQTKTSTERRAPPGFRHVFVRAAYNRNRFSETEIVR
jgi:hypothetical protein